MNTYKIAVIAGDGIGPEVIAEGVKVLKEVASIDGRFGFEFTYFPWGCEFYREHGKMMDDDGIEKLKSFDAIFLGAVGAPGVPDHISLWDLLLTIRKSFDQYINLRPVKLLEGAPTPIKGATKQNVDMIFVRENSEGEYAGSGAWLYKNSPNEVVIQNGVFSRKGCERVIRYAYELAKSQKKTLTRANTLFSVAASEIQIKKLSGTFNMLVCKIVTVVRQLTECIFHGKIVFADQRRCKIAVLYIICDA